MSLAADVLNTLKQVVLMNDKIERLEKAADKQEETTLNLRDRVIRLEAFIDVARASAHARALPPAGG